MNPTQWKAAVLGAVEDPSGWAFRGKCAYRVPTGWTCRAVLGSGSGFMRDHLYVHGIWMPLYLPFEHWVLSWGERSLAVSTQELQAPLRAAVAALPADDMGGLARIAGQYDSEAGRYAALLLNNFASAETVLSQPLAHGDDRPFVQQARARMATVLSTWRDGGASAATAQLES